MPLQRIRDLIAQAKIEKALEAAAKLPIIINDNDHKNTINLLSGQYSQNERSNRLGLVTLAQYQLAINKINHGLLTFLDELQNTKAEIAPDVLPTSSASGVKKEDDITKILFLASNPSDTARLQLTTEHSRVSQRLQNAAEPEKFPLKFHQAVTPSQFSEYLFLEKPDIVHFSGHGDRQAPEFQKLIEESRAGRKEVVKKEKEKEEAGIFLMDEDQRHAHFVSTTFLRRTFETIVKRLEIPVKVVIFNACHSAEQAKAISEVVPYVIGTSWSVGDKAAIAFASGFYFGIAQKMDIDDAFNFGIDQALAFNEPEDRFLLYKDGEKVVW